MGLRERLSNSERPSVCFLAVLITFSILGCLTGSKEFMDAAVDFGREHCYNNPSLLDLGDINQDGQVEHLVFPAGSVSGNLREGIILERGMLIQENRGRVKVLIEFTPTEKIIPGHVLVKDETYSQWRIRMFDSNISIGLKINARKKGGQERSPDILFWEKDIRQYAPMP